MFKIWRQKTDIVSIVECQSYWHSLEYIVKTYSASVWCKFIYTKQEWEKPDCWNLRMKNRCVFKAHRVITLLSELRDQKRTTVIIYYLSLSFGIAIEQQRKKHNNISIKYRVIRWNSLFCRSYSECCWYFSFSLVIIWIKTKNIERARARVSQWDNRKRCVVRRWTKIYLLTLRSSTNTHFRSIIAWESCDKNRKTFSCCCFSRICISILL